MATAVSARPAVPPQKVKRPPANVSASQNSSDQHLSSSPTASSKRPPPGLNGHGSTSAGNNSTNGTSAVGSRSTNRRRDSHRASDERQSKGQKNGVHEATPGDKRHRRSTEPYVKTTSYILKKHLRAPPSFVLHLHPTHFRFDEQDGSFSYSSPMRVLLEHIRAQTVPHEMLEELIAAGIKFYDNCLIVQIQDHRSSVPTTLSTSASSSKELNQPFSIHNYNKFITPSSFAPFPQSKASDSTNDSVQVSKESSDNPRLTPGDGVKSGAEANGPPKGPRTFTTVLFPTAFCLNEELSKIANTPDVRSSGRRPPQSSSKAPGSAVPATPAPAGFSSGVSSTSSNKKQKLMYSAKDLADIESKIISSTAPPLYLDPVNSLTEAQELIEKLQDPLLLAVPPAPKSRKRTVAELAADEALAAEEQRFMLVMDERLVPNPVASSATKNAVAVGEAGAVNFEARFERFKAIEEIKANLQEKRQREQEARVAMQHQQQKLKAEQQERDASAAANAAAARQQAAQQEQKAREIVAARRQEQLQLQARQHHAQNQAPVTSQQTSSQIPNQHTQSQSTATIMQNSAPLATSQPSHSSPVARNITPQNTSSPHTTNGVVGSTIQSMPMSASTSNQGAGSPPRPGSAMQHQAVTMAAQRAQQPPSRNGTPNMPNGTPRGQQATPVLRNNTPTPRMGHASPVSQAQTPNMSNFGPLANGQQQLTPHQQQLMFQRQQMHNQQQMQGGHVNAQMPGQNLPQQMVAQQFATATAQAQRPNADNYRQSLQNLQQQQMSAQMNHQQQFQGNLGIHSIPMQQNLPQQTTGAQQRWQSMYQSALQTFVNRFRDQAISTYGSQLPPVVTQQIRSQAQAKARAFVTAQRQQDQARQQMMAQQQLQNGGNMNHMGGGMGGMGNMNAM